MIKPRKTQTTRKFNMVFLYSEKCSENDSDMTLNLIIARNNGFVKKKSRKNYPVPLNSRRAGGNSYEGS